MITTTRVNHTGLMALAFTVLVGMMPLSLQADYLRNTDFREGSQCWHGDGQAAFLKPDGTEGAEGDQGVVPVIKITLSKSQPCSVFQGYETRDAPGRLHITVQVYTSADFKRSNYASDYQSDDSMPSADFMIRSLPDYSDKTATLKPGEWVTVETQLDSPVPADDRSVYFFAPPGEGTIYLKNPSVTP